LGTVNYTVANGKVIGEDRDGVRKFYRNDANGNVIGLYDNNQQLTDTFKYWPFGEVRTRTGSTPTPFQFTGEWGCRTSADGTIYMRTRDLSPKDGRFLTVDERWPHQSPYEYASSNPATFVDPEGREIQSDADELSLKVTRPAIFVTNCIPSPPPPPPKPKCKENTEKRIRTDCGEMCQDWRDRFAGGLFLQCQACCKEMFPEPGFRLTGCMRGCSGGVLPCTCSGKQRKLKAAMSISSAIEL
jgi:RHS repeat-associated protein